MRLSRSIRAGLLCGAAFLSGGLMAAGPAQAQENSDTLLKPDFTRDTLGEVGILDMPGAHMAPDGQLAVTFGDIGGMQRYSLSFQILPWMEGAFRYTHDGSQYYDRSFAVKVRLVREDGLLPDISVGLRNILGTGAYSSEYLVASKQIGDFDFTTGLGWGRLADDNTFPNPFGVIFPSFKTRTLPLVTAHFSGVADFKQFFHGPKAGIFGGVIWHTPVDGLSLLAEYSSDHYIFEKNLPTGPLFKVHSPLNLGLAYRFSSTISMSGGWFYGSTYGATFTLSGDTTSDTPSSERLGPSVPRPVVRSDKDQMNALSLLVTPNANVATASAGDPWTATSNDAGKAKQDSMQALLSEGKGIRHVDFQGKSMVIDADYAGDTQAQCARYAQIASAAGTDATSIAMTDLRSSDGRVDFCPIATNRQYADNSAHGALPIAAQAPAAAHKAPFEQTLRGDMTGQNISLDALLVSQSEAWVYYQNDSYQIEDEAAGRLARLLMADAPPQIEIFHLVMMSNGVPMQEVTLVRSALERATVANDTFTELGDAIAFSPPPFEMPGLDRDVGKLFPNFFWSLSPRLSERLFDPNKPLQFMVYADAGAGVNLAPGLSVSADITANIWNDYTFTRPPDSSLPHVRTDILKYLKDGKNGISSLDATYMRRLAPGVFGEVKVGYLEDMYMGAGGQALWTPENSRFSIGVDAYEVWKRDFDRLFGAQSYHVLTGHVTLYYRSPWYGLNFNVHAGRYLAGDYGATFETTRELSTGVEIGAYATFTNVPFSKFGEGSFDKGIIIHIPLEWGLPFYSQSAYDLHLSALTRDGGQRLADDDSLYSETRRTSYGEMAQNLDDFIDP